MTTAKRSWVSAVLLVFLVGDGATSLAAERPEVLAWDDCVREAKRQQPELIAAGEGVRAARAGLRASTSGYWPQISGSVGRSRSEADSTTDRYSYGFSGRQLVFDGFRTRAEVRRAEAQLRSGEWSREEISAELRYRLRSAYAGLLRVQELGGLTEEIAGRRKQNAELVELRYEAGREHKGSLLRSEAVVAQADFEIEQAKRALRVAQRRLLKELGRKDFEPIEVKGSLEIETVRKDKMPSLEGISEKHPTTGRLEASIAAQEAGVSSSRSSFLPDVSASASYGQSAEDWPPEEESWSLGISLSLPIFTGGRRIADLSRAEAGLAEAQARQRSGVDSIILALEDAWGRRMDALEMVEVKRKFLEAATERAKIAFTQYSSGLISFEDWNTIEDDLVAIRKALLNAGHDAMLGEANWVRAKGEGF